MKTFKDLIFEDHELIEHLSDEMLGGPMKHLKNSKHAKMEFDNGKTISVLSGKAFYSNGIDTYEARCIELGPEPKGYLTEQEVTDFMIEIQTNK